MKSCVGSGVAVVFMVVTLSLGAGCGDGDNNDNQAGGGTPTPARTATAGRTATPGMTNTVGSPTPVATATPVDGVARFAGMYEGTYSGDDHGTFDVEFDCKGTITGSGVSTDFDEEFDVDGTVSSSGGVTFAAGFTTADAIFSGTVGSDGRVSGQWDDPVEDLSGSFMGTRTDTFVCN